MDDNEILTQAEIERRILASASIIDVEKLIQAGIIEKKVNWYLVHRWNELPETVKSRITEMKTTSRKVKGQEPIACIYVKFRTPGKKRGRPPSSWQS